MPSSPADATTPSCTLHALDRALDQSHDVQAEVEACAEDLGSVNDLARARISGGATTLPAAQTLQNGLAIERRVQGCADDLQQLTDNLAHGLDEVKAVERALNRSRAALAASEAALAASRNAERVATPEHPADPLVLVRFDTLTPREREVFDLLVTGMSSKLIARKLGGSFRTIEIHRAQIMRKMAARHLPELVRMSIESMASRRDHAD